jgi:hypothetical protein
VLRLTDGAYSDHDRIVDGQTTTLFAPALKLPDSPKLQVATAGAGTNLVTGFYVDEAGLPQIVTDNLLVSTNLLIWPASATNYFLEFTTTLGDTNQWYSVSTTPAVFGEQNVVTNLSVDPTRFYRLRGY